MHAKLVYRCSHVYDMREDGSTVSCFFLYFFFKKKILPVPVPVRFGLAEVLLLEVFGVSVPRAVDEAVAPFWGY